MPRITIGARGKGRGASECRSRHVARIFFSPLAPRVLPLLLSPSRPTGAIFQRDSELRKPITDGVGHCEILFLPRGGAKLDDQVHELIAELRIAGLFLARCR